MKGLILKDILNLRKTLRTTPQLLSGLFIVYSFPPSSLQQW